jgi:hypothetical protein
MEQSPPWEADSHLAIQEIPRFLWNRKVHYLVHKSLPLVPALDQLDPVHILALCFLKSHFNIILPFTSFRISN